MKSILISIKPKYVAKILNGEKTIEIRKTAPKCELPIDVYIYCTKDKNKYLYWDWYDPPYVENEWFVSKNKQLFVPQLDRKKHKNGKVVAKFTLREVEKISMRKICGEWEVYGENNDFVELSRKSCLPQRELSHYIGGKYQAFAWYISDLQIFDNPKELSEFFYGFKLKNNGVVMFDYVKKALVQRTLWGYEYSYLLKKAPQSWCYVEEVKK